MSRFIELRTFDSEWDEEVIIVNVDEIAVVQPHGEGTKYSDIILAHCGGFRVCPASVDEIAEILNRNNFMCSTEL